MLSFLFAITLLILAPGANMLMILSLASSAGGAAARRAALGLTVGVCCHTIFAASGVSLVVHQWPAALIIIQRIGGAVLLWIGGKMIYDQFAVSPTHTGTAVVRRSAFLQGLLSSLSNVKTIVLFVSFLPQFFDTHAAVAGQFALFGGAYAAVTLGIYAIIGSVAGRFARTLQNPRVRTWLRAVAGLVICGFGISSFN